MSTKGRVVVTHGQAFEVREYDVPDPGPDDVLLKQELGGICGTDLHNWQNGIAAPTVMGHENTGIIAKLGKNVKTDYVGTPIKEGDRIVLVPGTPNGAYGFVTGPEKSPHFTGGFADYIHLSIPDTCYLKTSAPPEIAVLTEPFTIGIHAVLRSQMNLGDSVVVQGSGAIGLVTLICAKLSGAGPLIMVGGPKERLDLAKKFGADVVIDIEEVTSVEERTELVKSHTPGGLGAQVVFECAGFLPATPEGLGYLRRDGIFVEVGHFVDMGEVAININQLMMRKNIRFEAVWASRREDFIRGLPILERNELPYADMVSHVLPLEDVAKGFDALNGNYRLDGETVFKIAVGSDV